MIDRIEPLQRPHPLPVRNALTATMVGLSLSLAACGGSVVAKTDSAVADTGPQSEYHIGAGDALNIFVLNHADLSQQVPVRPDGLISTPLIEDMRAAGKTPSELARDME